MRPIKVTVYSVALVISVFALIYAGAAPSPASAAHLTCAGLASTIDGTSGDDVLIGTAGPDVIVGLEGNDIIIGLEGDDVICAGPGDDIVDSGPGFDSIFGEDGHDILKGGDDDDLIDGGSGKDRLMGNFGDDTLDCGGGNDYADGGSDSDPIGDADDIALNCEVISPDVDNGEPGDGVPDVPLTCQGQPATIIGTPGDDVLFGTSGPDVIVGLDGHDVIIAGGGDDLVCGGPGLDVIYGNSGDDSLFGERSHDVLIGGGGADFLHGGTGRDVLSGGPKNDTLVCGGQYDFADGGGGDDVVDDNCEWDAEFSEASWTGGGGTTFVGDNFLTAEPTVNGVTANVNGGGVVTSLDILSTDYLLTGAFGLGTPAVATCADDNGGVSCAVLDAALDGTAFQMAFDMDMRLVNIVQTTVTLPLGAPPGAPTITVPALAGDMRGRLTGDLDIGAGADLLQAEMEPALFGTSAGTYACFDTSGPNPLPLGSLASCVNNTGGEFMAVLLDLDFRGQFRTAPGEGAFEDIKSLSGVIRATAQAAGAAVTAAIDVIDGDAIIDAP
jgi:Ca2+-binding RTX toxin-like protein